METDKVLFAAAGLVGGNALALFFAGLVFLLAGIVLAYRLLQRYPLRHESGKHSVPVLAVRFGLGFFMILTCGAIFTALADEIGLEEEMAQFDSHLTLALVQNTSMEVRQVFSWITHLGDTMTYTSIGIITALTLFYFGLRWLALGWVVAVAGNSLLNVSLKAVFERGRPVDEQGLALIGGWSFPSGHASGAVVVYGMLSYILICTTPKAWHLPIVLAAATLAFSIGSSRVFLQYHYASDVLAGFVSGAAWLAVCISTMIISRWQYSRRKSVLG